MATGGRFENCGYSWLPNIVAGSIDRTGQEFSGTEQMLEWFLNLKPSLAGSKEATRIWCADAGWGELIVRDQIDRLSIVWRKLSSWSSPANSLAAVSTGGVASEGSVAA